jgi:hypothetical protein
MLLMMLISNMIWQNIPISIIDQKTTGNSVGRNLNKKLTLLLTNVIDLDGADFE